MRREHGVRRAEQRMIRADGLLLEHVQAGAPQAVGLQCRRQRHGVDHGAARRVHHHGRVLHQRQALGIQHVVRVGRQRRMERHNVGALQQLVVRHDVVALGRAPAGLQGTGRADDGESQAVRLTCRCAADFAHAHHAEHAAMYLAERALVGMRPNALAEGGVQLVRAAQHVQRQRDSVVGNHLRAVAGNIADCHSAVRSRLDVDAVVAHAGARDDARVRQFVEYTLREASVRRDDAVGVARVFDDAVGAGVLERLDLHARLVGHALLDFRVLEVAVDDYDFLHVPFAFYAISLYSLW